MIFEKDALWQDWFIKHLPGGMDDPNYAIIRFDTVKAEIYISDRNTAMKLAGLVADSKS